MLKFLLILSFFIIFNFLSVFCELCGELLHAMMLSKKVMLHVSVSRFI